jgi:hypothetical protein
MKARKRPRRKWRWKFWDEKVWHERWQRWLRRKTE